MEEKLKTLKDIKPNWLSAPKITIRHAAREWINAHEIEYEMGVLPKREFDCIRIWIKYFFNLEDE